MHKHARWQNATKRGNMRASENAFEIFMYIYLLFCTDDQQILIIMWYAIEYISYIQYQWLMCLFLDRLSLRSYSLSLSLSDVTETEIPLNHSNSWPGTHAYIPIKLISPQHTLYDQTDIFIKFYWYSPKSQHVRTLFEREAGRRKYMK